MCQFFIRAIELQHLISSYSNHSPISIAQECNKCLTLLYPLLTLTTISIRTCIYNNVHQRVNASSTLCHVRHKPNKCFSSRTIFHFAIYFYASQILGDFAVDNKIACSLEEILKSKQHEFVCLSLFSFLSLSLSLSLSLFFFFFLYSFFFSIPNDERLHLNESFAAFDEG